MGLPPNDCLARPGLGCWHSRHLPGPRNSVWQRDCRAAAPTVSVILREDHQGGWLGQLLHERLYVRWPLREVQLNSRSCLVTRSPYLLLLPWPSCAFTHLKPSSSIRTNLELNTLVGLLARPHLSAEVQTHIPTSQLPDFSRLQSAQARE